PTPLFSHASCLLDLLSCYPGPAPRLRLSDGPHGCAGRLEVWHGGRWGSVCDDAWDLRDAAVACRELGCGGALAAPGGAFFGEGTGPITLDDLRCRGNETALRFCPARPWGQHDCHHREDAGAVCDASCLLSFCISSMPGSPGLRLVAGPSRCSGRLEVWHDGRWGTVCDDIWDTRDSAVVCRELGCGGPRQPDPAGGRFGWGAGPIWLDDVSCVGTESSLSDCPAAPWGKHNCAHNEDVGVTCTGPFRVRLADGPNRCAGRLEVWHAGRWGTVCDDNWDLRDGTVACWELGCGKVRPRVGKTHYGPGTGPIWLDDVGCKGTETSLSDCPSGLWGKHNCDHEEDVGLTCTGRCSLPRGGGQGNGGRAG
uniref:Soluble scavenger receptor cysteine-rich domain-containing protein SSC5D n=1 Tax=Spermophilus dauricus TaxID=99837 RepID=A0A8C9PFA6_SPEDA